MAGATVGGTTSEDFDPFRGETAWGGGFLSATAFF